MPEIASPLPPAAAALHPLVERLMTAHGYAYVNTPEDLGTDPRDRLLFLPAHGKSHMETPDIAVVLPELVRALDHGRRPLTGAVAGPAIERILREAMALALPAIVVLRDGEPIGSIARMRDWDEYLARLGTVLADACVTH
ncbi:MAG: hydrogenase [Rhizobiales bacterium 24-66-13]|jgi:hydrogenase-1 operon protein HyaE|nr:MAG: hydrogenase [Rhizobiales bacterium 24-66-13]HQS09274.1 hydrogenase [Xanthobacteraceae bacterium]HQS47207.1 hydrogenase [Xanthobacteraceae bacterium]